MQASRGPDEAPGHSIKLLHRASQRRAGGDYGGARSLVIEWLAGLEQKGAHPQGVVAQAWMLLGLVDEDLGRYRDAEASFQRAIEAVDAMPQGDEHQRLVMQSLTQLANGHRRQGRYQDAQTLLRQTLDQAETAFGVNAFELVEPLN